MFVNPTGENEKFGILLLKTGGVCGIMGVVAGIV